MILRMGTAAAVVVLLTLMAIVASPGTSSSPLFARIFSLTGGQGGEPSIPEAEPAVLIGAGDINVCGQGGDTATAALVENLLDRYPGAQVFTAGDNVQIMGAAEEYSQCFDPTWGRFKDRIHPSPGNHDWFVEDGAPYFAYFGEAAGPPGLGYYSYDLGDWHIVSLNSNCGDAGCDEGSAQAEWLRENLRENDKSCTLLYWHHPLWSSGYVEINPAGMAFWRIASAFKADVVVNGHEHHYERFAPLGPSGRLDNVSGMRPFIVGTGGAWLFEFGQPLITNEVRDNTTTGVILFFLYPGRYTWQFVPTEKDGFTDQGSGMCH